MERLAPGLYEKVVDLADRARIEALDSMARRRPLRGEESARRLAVSLKDLILRVLEDLPDDARPAAQIEVCNRILGVLVNAYPETADARDALTAEVLEAVVDDAAAEMVRPSVPLSESALFVNATRERRIDSELVREVSSADEVEFICPFLFWSGYRLIRSALLSLRRRGGRLRVLTSTYCGMTEARVLDDLVRAGAEVRVSYETKSTRLHAKAWFFRRRSGYSTAFVGSSNLSHAALTSGLEWNVRLSQIENRATLEEFEHAFENHWHDSSFEAYDPEVFAERLRREERDDRLAHVFDLRPYPFQQEILDRLSWERDRHDRHRHLVVAATGTGKTVIAALDYQRLCKGTRPTLLFVAHRQEILRQARAAYRHATGDGSFGELQTGGDVPRDGRQVFASVQALSHVDLESWDPRRFEILVVDEFHHASEDNRTYARLLERLQPRELLGLTATPERSDGVDVKSWFDGRVTAEIRLWDAIDRGLLVPFQYFGVHDGVDLTGLTWTRGRYDSRDLEGVYDGNDARAHLVCKAVQEIVDDTRTMRALGFCVGVGHAHYMAAAFRRAGLEACAVTGDTPGEERVQAIAALRAGTLRAIFAVDVFNEGVDLPELDTLLFLRPTESATLFIQQLGRGLRHHDGKRCLTVLDFVGRAHAQFRYDLRFRALTGMGRSALKRQVEEGFPLLPAGCSIQLDKESQDAILENLRKGIGGQKNSLLAELRALGDCGLASFLDECELTPGDLYRSGRSFSELRRAAGLPTPSRGPREDELARSIGRMIHVNDAMRLEHWPRFLDGATPRDGFERRLHLMLATALLGGAAAADPAGALETFRGHAALFGELKELLAYLGRSLERGTLPFRARAEVPLQVHGRYTRDEIMAAFSLVHAGKLAAPQAGVVWDPNSRCKILFVTITKDANDYSPTTLYKDYALSPTRFHWQSQNSTRQESEAGRRLIEHESQGITPLLFIRATKDDDRGATLPYDFAGPLRLLSARGERPIDIEWQLEEPLPPALFRQATVAAV